MSEASAPLRTKAPTRTRVVIADSFKANATLTAAFLEAKGNCEVVATTTSGIEALRLCEQWRPSVLVLELTLPELCGWEVLAQLRRRQIPTRGLVWTSCVEPQPLIAALRRHPAAVAHKEDSLPGLLAALRAMEARQTFFCQRATELREKLDEGDESLMLAERELAVLQMIAEGKSTKEIAERLCVSAKTIEGDRQKLTLKLGVKDVAGFTREAVRLGLVP